MSAQPFNDRFMNVKQVAEYLHLNEKKVYSLVNDGEIPATKVTGKWMFPRELVDRWMLDSAHGGLLSDRLVISGSDDPLLYRLLLKFAHQNGNRALVSYTPSGTRQGLDLLQAQRVNASVMHWGPDVESGMRHPALLAQYGQHPSWVLIHAFRREQGLMLQPDIADDISSDADLMQGRYRWALRQSGSGAQRYLMETIARRGGITDELNQSVTCYSDREAASALRMNLADVAPGSRASATEYDLAFLPLGWVSVDLALSKTVWFRHLFQEIVRSLKTIETHRMAEELGGYDLTDSGSMVWGQQ